MATNVITFSNMTLTTGTSYSYRVRARNATGDSSYSNIATATPTAPTTPAAPTNLVARTASSTQINLTWTDNSNNETGFRIERCSGVNCTTFAEIATTGVNVATYNNTPLTAGTSYSYRVRANNGTLNSAYTLVTKITIVTWQNVSANLTQTTRANAS